MKIYLFRHGEKQTVASQDFDTNRSVVLTEKGIEQIKALAETLSGFEDLKTIAAIYSSPMARAVQSAEIVRARLGLKQILPDTRLREYYAFNDYKQNKAHRQEMQKQMFINPKFVSPETGHSLDEYITNTKKFFSERYQAEEQTILVSAHGALIRSLCYSIDSGLRPGDDEILGALIQEGGYSVLDFDGTNYTVVQFDSI